MANAIARRLEEMGITLPDAPRSVASYAGYQRHNDLLFISGQLPFENGKLTHTGLLGREVKLAEGQAAARICAINLLAQVSAALSGDLERVGQCLRLGGFVASDPAFHEQPAVVDGASRLIGEIMGELGTHARAAVGVACLPLNACVEVEAVFAVR